MSIKLLSQSEIYVNLTKEKVNLPMIHVIKKRTFSFVMIITTDKPKIENESIYLNKYYI